MVESSNKLLKVSQYKSSPLNQEMTPSLVPSTLSRGVLPLSVRKKVLERARERSRAKKREASNPGSITVGAQVRSSERAPSSKFKLALERDGTVDSQ